MTFLSLPNETNLDHRGDWKLLTKILKMEEDHVDWADIQRVQIEQMGLENYLENQTDA